MEVRRHNMGKNKKVNNYMRDKKDKRDKQMM
jgi:hypothetical protein